MGQTEGGEAGVPDGAGGGSLRQGSCCCLCGPGDSEVVGKTFREGRVKECGSCLLLIGLIPVELWCPLRQRA